MRIRIIYIVTVISILLAFGITIYYNSLTGHFLLVEVEPRCGDWVYGSCVDKQLYMERTCYNYTSNCTQEIYYERRLEQVKACSQADCLEGNFVNYTCE